MTWPTMAMALEESTPAFVPLTKPIPLRYAVLEGKVAARVDGEGYVPRLASHCVELAARDFYGKVIRAPAGNGAPAVVRLTSVRPEVDAFLEALRRYATAPS